MIEDFFQCCANGYKISPEGLPTDIPLLDLLKPEYKRTHYSWMVEGVPYSREIDGIDTLSMDVAPDQKHLLVMQSPEKYAPNNVLILNSDGSEFMRLENPYPHSPEYQEGDYYEFDDVDTRTAWGGKVRALIYVSRTLPGKSYEAEPHYDTFYDCETWEHTPLEFVTSKAL